MSRVNTPRLAEGDIRERPAAPRGAAGRTRMASPPPPPRLQDRPSRFRVMLRRQRRKLRPLLAFAAVSVVALVFVGLVGTLGTGANFREKFGAATARMGFRVQSVQVTGNLKTPEPLLRAALGVAAGDPTLTFSPTAARARLEGIQWVQVASVERRLPGTILVHLTERSPYAVWQHDGRFVLIDRDGNTVTDSDVALFASQVPLVVGPGAPKAARALIEALSAQPTLMARLVAAVRVGDRRWNLRLNNGCDVLLPEGAEAPALARLVELQATHALLDRPLQVIDMRLPDRLVVRPVAETAAPAGNPVPNAVPPRKPT